jgi:hypothetical protein
MTTRRNREMTKKYGISKNEQKYRKNFRAFCSAAMELKKDDLRAVNTIIEEALRPSDIDGEATLKPLFGSPDALMTAFEKRWGPISPGRGIPMPPPPDIPSEGESIMNGNEPLTPCEVKRTRQDA